VLGKHLAVNPGSATNIENPMFYQWGNSFLEEIQAILLCTNKLLVGVVDFWNRKNLPRVQFAYHQKVAPTLMAY
jgi:hypothetical protein